MKYTCVSNHECICACIYTFEVKYIYLYKKEHRPYRALRSQLAVANTSTFLVYTTGCHGGFSTSFSFPLSSCLAKRKKNMCENRCGSNKNNNKNERWNIFNMANFGRDMILDTELDLASQAKQTIFQFKIIGLQMVIDWHMWSTIRYQSEGQTPQNGNLCNVSKILRILCSAIVLLACLCEFPL